MCDDDSLLAEAAMQRILRRTLPAQRHEVLGAMSALKLQLAVARRRLLRDADAPPQPDDAQARLQQVDAMADQQLAAQSALIGFRLWDGLAVQRQPLHAVLTQSADWTRQAAAMRGHHLADAQAPAPSTTAEAQATPSVEVPAAHFLVLAWLYASLDRLTAPCQLDLTLASEGVAWRIGIRSSARSDQGGLPPPPVAPTPGTGPARWLQTTISGAMVQALSRHVVDDAGQWQCEMGPGPSSSLVYRATR